MSKAQLAFDTSKIQIVFEAFIIPASAIIVCVASAFVIYLIWMMRKGYFPVVAMVAKDDSDLIDALIEAQGKIRGKE